MAWGVAWTGLTLCTFAFFDPFDRYRWREEDWFNFTVIWLLPIFGGVASDSSCQMGGRRVSLNWQTATGDMIIKQSGQWMSLPASSPLMPAGNVKHTNAAENVAIRRRRSLAPPRTQSTRRRANGRDRRWARRSSRARTHQSIGTPSPAAPASGDMRTAMGREAHGFAASNGR